jgi:hypothetical protein
MSTAPVTPSTRELPAAPTLEAAVQEVIRSNKLDGYVPTVFIQQTAGKNGVALRDTCQGLLYSASALSNIATQLLKPGKQNLLTIEDYISRFGLVWAPAFSPADVQKAQESVDAWDALVHHRRYR